MSHDLLINLMRKVIKNIMIFVCSIQNPSSHTEKVSGIMKRMGVKLLILIVNLSQLQDKILLLFIRHSRYYVWIIRQLMSAMMTFNFIFIISLVLDSTLQINHKMSASNDELLFNAARDGDLKKVKELLSKGVGTGYKDEVS